MKRGVLGALVVSVLPWLAATAQDTELIAEQAEGLVPLQDESRVLVRGIQGRITLHSAPVGGVQFKATDAVTKADAPVRVLSEAGRIVFEPKADRADRRYALNIFLPRNVASSVEAAASEVILAMLESATEIKGEGLAIHATDVSGAITMELTGGSFELASNSGDVVLRGRGWKGAVESSSGRLAVYGGPGALEVQQLANGFDAELEGVKVRAVGIEGEVRVRARQGELEINDALAGGELRLFGAPLNLARSKGRFDVFTDSAVRFNALEGGLYVEGDSASVQGRGGTEAVEVRTHDATVILEKIEAAVRIEGAGLQVQLKDIGGGAQVVSTASTIDLASVVGDVIIESEGGDVRLASVSGKTDVKSSGGIVRINGQIGAVMLDADGPEATVEWSILPPGEESRIENRNGPVTVRLPASGNGCRIEARSRFGRVEAPFKRVVVSADKTGAQGWVGSDTKTLVRIDAVGDVLISGGPPDRSEAPGEP